MAGIVEWADLDELFACPSSIKDEKLRELYQALYARMTRELQAVELTTAQVIQGSLMIGWTVKHLQTSRRDYGDKTGYQHASQEKDAIMALEGILKDWNDVIIKLRAQRDRGKTGVPVEVLQEVLGTVLSRLDPAVRAPIVSDIATQLSEYTV
jgi:hypothetical protein